MLNLKVREILRKIKGSLMGHSAKRLTSLINTLHKESLKEENYSYGRDYKKEGLARPKLLTKWALECLEERYPNEFSVFFPMTDLYLTMNEDTPWGRKGEEVLCPRGTGLGMFNEVVTLISLAIFEMTFRRLEGDTPKIRDSCFLGVWNDDSLLVCREETMILVSTTDISVHQDLDYFLNFDKTTPIKGGSWILGQIASNTFDVNKDYLYRMILWSKVGLSNIVQAKAFIASFQWPEGLQEDVNQFVSSYPNEFYEGEKEMSSLWGGWVNTLKNYLRTDLIQYAESDTFRQHEMYCAFLARRKKPPSIKSSLEKRLTKQRYTHVFSTGFFLSSTEDLIENPFFDVEPFVNNYDFKKKLLTRSHAMSRSQSVYWMKRETTRISTFHKLIREREMKHDLTPVLQELSRTLYAIPEEYITRWEPANEFLSGKNWFSKELFEGVTNDREYLSIATQKIIQPSIQVKNYGVGELSLDELAQLDALVEPRGFMISEGAYPWHTEAWKLGRIFHNPLLLIMFYNAEKEFLPLCKIPLEFSLEIPPLPSYHFANEDQRKKLDLYYQNFHLQTTPIEWMNWKTFIDGYLEPIAPYIEIPQDYTYLRKDVLKILRFYNVKRELSRVEIARVLERYLTELEEQRRLKSLEHDENTIVYFSSDVTNSVTLSRDQIDALLAQDDDDNYVPDEGGEPLPDDEYEPAPDETYYWSADDEYIKDSTPNQKFDEEFNRIDGTEPLSEEDPDKSYHTSDFETEDEDEEIIPLPRQGQPDGIESDQSEFSQEEYSDP